MIESLLDWISKNAKIVVEKGTSGNWKYALYSDGTAELSINGTNKSVGYGPTNNFGGYLGFVSEQLPEIGKTLTDFNVVGTLIPQNTRCVQSIARVYNGTLQLASYADSAKTVYSDYNAQIKCKWE